MAPPSLPLSASFTSTDWLTLLDVSLTGIQLLRPLYTPDGPAIVDFALEYTNPAGLRMVGFSEPPGGTLLQHFPYTLAAGVFAYYQRAFEASGPLAYETHYQADGVNNHFRFSAQRSGERLLVNFTDTSDQPRSAVEQALRASQAREQAARAEAEAQRGELQRLFAQAPVAMALFKGPEHVIELANEPMAAIWGRTLAQTLGQPVFAALPYVQNQGFEIIFAEVLAQGTPYDLYAVPVTIDRPHTGQPTLGYFDLTYRPQRDAQGQITGIITSAYEVTEQVLARQQVEQLNHELEARVHERTQAALALQADVLAAAQRQARERETFYQVFAQTPAAVSIQRGPAHHYEYANQAYQDFFPGRSLLGQSVVEAVPEVVDSGILALLDRVYQTGEPYNGIELPLLVAQPQGPPRQMYFTFTFQPYREDGEVVGISTFAYNVAEQVLARHEREAQQRRLQTIFEQAPVAIFVLHGPTYVLDVVNPPMGEVLGRTPDELLGRPYFEAMPELATQGYAAFMDQVWRTGRPFTAREQPAKLKRHQAGETGYFTFVYQPLFDAQGQLTDIMCVALDETEQVRARQRVEQLNQELEARVHERTQQAEAARTEAEAERQRLHQVLMSMPANIALLSGPAHVYDLVNPEYERLFPTRIPLGHPIREVIPELEGQGFYELFDRVYETGKPYYEAETEAWADFAGTGTPQRRYYRTSFEPIRNAQGQVTEVLNFAVDVTEQVEARRQVEQLNQELEARVAKRTRELSEQQDLLRQILSRVPAYIATLSGPEHRYSFYNDAYQALSGGRITLGARAVDVFPEIVPQGFLTLLDQVYTSGVAVAGTDTPAMLVNPATGQLEPLHADFIYQPLVDEHQQVKGILAYVQDVSEKIGARQQVQELNEQLTAINAQLTTSNARLTRTNTDLDTFVYTASHDLKAPITNIEGILHALRETLPPAVQHDGVVAHLLGLLDNTVSRFQATIYQLTDLSRLQQTYNEPAEMLLLAPVVADVLTDLAPAIAAAAAQVQVQVPAELRVSFAPASLRSVVYNLLSNAVKYRDPARPAQVWLTAERRPEAVVLTVRDNGLGLTATQQTRLFGVFQRLHTHVEGTGVGLYMIKRLIENAGASIAVTSAPTIGSTFTVTFPN